MAYRVGVTPERGSGRADNKQGGPRWSFPDGVRKEVGFALYQAQCGGKAINALPLLGFGSAKVLEVAINDDGGTYRAVYTVKFADAVYVLHAFQKKSIRGSATPRPDMKLIKSRLKAAEADYRARQAEQRKRELAHEKGA